MCNLGKHDLVVDGCRQGVREIAFIEHTRHFMCVILGSIICTVGIKTCLKECS